MKQYLEVYKNFIGCSLTEELSFRVNFVMLLIVDLIFTLSTLGAAIVLFQHVDTLGPWSKDQLLFFLCFMMLVDDFQGMVLSSNFWMLSLDLKMGNLDFTFLKPINSLFPMFFRYLRPSSIVSLTADIVLLIYFGQKLNFDLVQFIALIPLAILAITLRFLIEMVISLTMFWTTEGVGINFIRLQLQSLSRWPDFIYKGMAKRLLSTILPVLLIGSAPMHFVFDFNQWQQMITLVVLIIFFSFFLKVLWSQAKKRYESASS